MRKQLLLRVVIDCSYLFRSALATRKKLRVLLEYIWLTLKVVIRPSAPKAGTTRVLGYSVRHFGIGSLQFLFREIFVRGDYFLEVTGDRPLVFDCGANIGLSTLFFKWLYPNCEVHAFEPDPETFEILKENVSRNGLANVHLHNVALTGSAGQLAFFVPSGSSGSPLMSTVSSRSGPGSRRLVVEGVPLSRYISGREIDLVKMDVEGAEEMVLREAAAAGSLRHVREIAVEYHHNLEAGISRFGSFLQLLQDAGYHYQVDATWKGGGSAGAFQDIMVRARRATRSQSVHNPHDVIAESAVAV
jgi:FkbM family methyltransferase